MTVSTRVKLKRLLVEKSTVPAVLSVAGSDNSGGAGIEADLKTLTAHGVYGLTCITAITCQNTQRVEDIVKTPEYVLRNIFRLNLEDFLFGYSKTENIALKVIKTGMLTTEAVKVLKENWASVREKGIKLVIDPVMVSTTGSELCDKMGMKICIDELMKDAYLVTPNFKEALVLYELASDEAAPRVKIQCLDDLTNFTIDLQNRLGCQSIIVKGGHLPWDSVNDRPFELGEGDMNENKTVVDILYESEGDAVTVFESGFVETECTHGTGCTLSSAIAANLAKDFDLKKSVCLSINYVQTAMESFERKMGQGHGPLNHYHAPRCKLSDIIDCQTSTLSTYILDNFDSFLDYFKQHPVIEMNWLRYIHHPFVSQLASNQLQLSKFLHFLNQDYFYLVNYAQVHGLAASLTNDHRQIEAQSEIIQEIITEIKQHKQKLTIAYGAASDANFAVDSTLSKGKACAKYCDFLLDTGKQEDFLGVKVALAPCLHGYGEAANWGQELRSKLEESGSTPSSSSSSEIYSRWLADYTSIWYLHACERGKDSLQTILEQYPLSPSRLEELVDIFNHATLLEIDFWNEVLNLQLE